MAFIFVNLSVIFTYVRFVKERGWRAALGFVVLPALGVAINIALWFSLEPSAMIVGAVWVALGLGYLLWRTRFFRVAPPALAGPVEQR